MRFLTAVGVALAVPVICVLVLLLMYVSYILAIFGAIVMIGYLAYSVIPVLRKPKQPD